MKMNEIELKINLKYLINKYISDKFRRNELLDLINKDVGCAKYVIYSIDQFKTEKYDDKDRILIKDIAYYFI